MPKPGQVNNPKGRPALSESERSIPKMIRVKPADLEKYASTGKTFSQFAREAMEFYFQNKF